MRIINDNSVTPDTCQAGDGRGNTKATNTIDKIQLLILIFGQLDKIAPSSLIPFGSDKLTHASAIASR